MAIGDVIKLGTLYVNDTKSSFPTNPIDHGDIPNYEKLRGNIEFKNTDIDDKYNIKWIQVTKDTIICDRNILMRISYDDLNTQGFIQGKQINIGKIKGIVRILTFAEWKKYINCENTWNYNLIYSWVNNNNTSMLAGYDNIHPYFNMYPSYVDFNTGFRPVLIVENTLYLRNKKYLIKQNNNYCSLKSSFHKLGQPSNNEELEKWYKEHGVDDLNVLLEKKNSKPVCLKLDKNDIYKTVTNIDFNEVTEGIEYIDEDNKKEIKYGVKEYQLLDLIKEKIGSKFQIAKWEEK